MTEKLLFDLQFPITIMLSFRKTGSILGEWENFENVKHLLDESFNKNRRGERLSLYMLARVGYSAAATKWLQNRASVHIGAPHPIEDITPKL